MSAKVTVHDTEPSADKPARASKAKATVVTDALGRKIGVRKLSALDKFELSMLMGPQSTNMGAMQHAVMACSATSIDGEEVSPPATMGQLRIILQRLDDDGLEAVAQAYMDMGWLGEELINPDAVKN